MMKRVSLVMIVLLLSLGGKSFADPYGPPEPEGMEDQTTLGAGFFHHSENWKPGSGNFGKVSVIRNQAFLQASFAGHSISDTGAVFLRAGGANFDDGSGFQDGYKPFGTVGFRDVWFDERDLPVAIGTIFQASYCPGYKSDQTFLPGFPVSAKIRSIWNVGMGVAAQKHLFGKKLLLYGGPQVVYGGAKVERTVTGSPPESTKYKEDSLVGLFAGGRVSLGRRFAIEAEGQYRGRISGGVSVSCTF